MIEQLFLQILNMSIIGGIVILFILVSRLFLKKVPKIFSYILWSVALLRLLVPFSFESMLSLIPINPRPISNESLYVAQTNIGGISGQEITISPNLTTANLAEPVNPMQTFISIGAMLWIAGIFLLLIYSLFTLYRLKGRLASSVHEKDNIYISHEIDMPFVLGLIRPKIYLPVSLSESERDYIVLHEQTHIKRFDHVFRIIGYLALLVHWFNPLVWIAFHVSGKDMEMSCDESVIKAFGDKVKSDYSISLLSLATGRRNIGVTPLAFGEGDTKGRVKNVMNYKKPMFWVIIIALIFVIVLSFGLLANPKNEGLTVEQYAENYVQQVIEEYENAEYQNFKVVDHKITSLDRIAVFDEIFNHPIELWLLEYRIKPDKIENVMLAGGMNEIDGWITEDSSMGKPVMVFSYDKKVYDHIGIIWTGEMGETLSGNEIALRQLLESKGYLPHETFEGKHALVKFNLSTGETCQALLSKPVRQGDDGIWCVERWMDGNGSIYYSDPMVNTTLSEYYTELQEQCDQGHKPWLLDLSQVAMDFIYRSLGQSQDSGILELIDNARVEDFLQTPTSAYIGYIYNFADSYPDMFHFDPVEWITLDDTDRLEDLGIGPQDMPNGYYIHNPIEDIFSFKVNEDTEYNFIDWGNDFVGIDQDRFYSTKDKQEFIRYLDTYSDRAAKVPFVIETKDGYVTSITEQFVN
ncbi:MAG: hypothetical protein GX363_05895 [Clostridiales bacterium]|nr:hypothetical protein [Clostridiales bacterium]